MAWSASKVGSSFLTDSFNLTTNTDLNSDTIKVALFDNSVTPDQTVASALFAYNAGVWAAGGVADASGWPAAGRSLASITSTFSGATYTFDAADTVSANGNTTLGANFGALIYDSTIASPVANPGIAFLYFGGSNSVTNGTYTLIYNAAGLFGASL